MTRVLCSSDPWTPDMLEHLGPEQEFYGAETMAGEFDPRSYRPVIEHKDRWGTIWIWLAVAGGLYTAYRLTKR